MSFSLILVLGLWERWVDNRSAAVAGLKGFGAGLFARILTIAPGNAITWLVFEQVKAWLGRQR